MRKHILIAIFVTSLFTTGYLAGTYPETLTYLDQIFYRVEQNVAAVLLHKPVTVAELKEKYKAPEEKKVRILLVPGHEPSYGGTEYGSLKEREMNVELAKYLGEFLRGNEHYDVMLTRDNDRWSPTFLTYFITEWDNIIKFFRENKNQSFHNVSGNITRVSTSAKTSEGSKPKVIHNNARTDVALRLYGINKWGNENSIDIAIHIHFNDHPRHNHGGPGTYSGFTVYVPESDYANSPTTKAVAETIFRRLSKYNAVSDLPVEDEGIVEEGDLIAVGAHNTSNAASMLIEYGYIYEQQFQDPEVRSRTLKDLAFQTYLGLQDFFGSGNDVSFAYDTLMLPHKWTSNVSQNKANPNDVLALQSALLLDGFYPTSGKTKNDCPRSGKIGPCTLGALDAFQKRYGIQDENGYVGEKTRLILNGKYSLRAVN